MTARTAFITMAALTLAACAASALLYASLPEMIPMHWNASGQIDGWGHKQGAAWFVPGLMLALVALTWLLPWLSPHRFRVDEFRATYHTIMVGLAVMFAGIHAIMLGAALHPGWDSSRWLIGGLCLALGFIGNLLGKVRRNFWVGVRTPWTLASDVVWDATHRLAARLMSASGLVGALVIVAGGPPAVAFVVVLSGAIVPALWSLVYYKRFESAGRL